MNKRDRKQERKAIQFKHHATELQASMDAAFAKHSIGFGGSYEDTRRNLVRRLLAKYDLADPVQRNQACIDHPDHFDTIIDEYGIILKQTQEKVFSDYEKNDVTPYHQLSLIGRIRRFFSPPSMQPITDALLSTDPVVSSAGYRICQELSENSDYTGIFCLEQSINFTSRSTQIKFLSHDQQHKKTVDNNTHDQLIKSFKSSDFLYLSPDFIQNMSQNTNNLDNTISMMREINKPVHMKYFFLCMNHYENQLVYQKNKLLEQSKNVLKMIISENYSIYGNGQIQSLIDKNEVVRGLWVSDLAHAQIDDPLKARMRMHLSMLKTDGIDVSDTLYADIATGSLELIHYVNDGSDGYFILSRQLAA